MVTVGDAQLWAMSTAGTARSVWWRERLEAGRAAAQMGVDTGLATLEWAADPGADPTNEATWWSCMPALGRLADVDTVRQDLTSMGVKELRRAYCTGGRTRPTRAGRCCRASCGRSCRYEPRLRWPPPVDPAAAAGRRLRPPLLLVQRADAARGRISTWTTCRMGRAIAAWHTPDVTGRMAHGAGTGGVDGGGGCAWTGSVWGAGGGGRRRSRAFEHLLGRPAGRRAGAGGARRLPRGHGDGGGSGSRVLRPVEGAWCGGRPDGRGDEYAPHAR
jgi:hypothetical protein